MRLLILLLALLAAPGRPQTASPSRSPVAQVDDVFGPNALVLLRIGDGTQTAGLHTARPLFSDLVDVATGSILASYPWRAQSQVLGNGVLHHRCTQSWSVNSNMQLSSDFRFLMVGCYDAVPYSEELYPWLLPNASKASRRVLGRMAADASVDSRTVVAASECDEARVTCVASTTGEWMAVSTIPLMGARDPSRCSLRVVPYGNVGGGDYGLRNPAAWSVSGLTLAFRSLLAYDSTRASGVMEVGYQTQDRPDIDSVMVQRMPSLLQLPADQQPQTVVGYVADDIRITQFPDGSTSEWRSCSCGPAADDGDASAQSKQVCHSLCPRANALLETAIACAPSS